MPQAERELPFLGVGPLPASADSFLPEATLPRREEGG